MSLNSEILFDQYRRVYNKTQGWLFIGAAAVCDCLLVEQTESNNGGNLIEIGVWHGKSASLLLMHTAPQTEKCYLVDVKFAEREVHEAFAETGVLNHENLFVLREMKSRDFASSPEIEDLTCSFRFAHIDGEHTRKAVFEDLELCDNLLNKAGIVCLDDFMSPMYPQVTSAVYGYMSANPGNFALFLCGFNKGFLARPSHVPHYISFVRTRLSELLEARSVKTTIYKTTASSDMNCFGIGPRMRFGTFRGPDWDEHCIDY